MSWKPIETAPHDREVLLWIPTATAYRRKCFIGVWDDDEYSLRRPRPYWRTDAALTMGVLWQRNNQPTHWAEIPEGPK